jgi:hypothetical protein
MKIRKRENVCLIVIVRAVLVTCCYVPVASLCTFELDVIAGILRTI